MEKNTSLTERDHVCIWHPFTRKASYTIPDAIPIQRGKGVYLYAEDGTAYLDGISSWWVNLHGHAHPYIASKISDQAQLLEQVIFAGFTHLPAVALAERLLRLLPQRAAQEHLARVFYSDNGSTAVETALKMALQYTYNQDPLTKRTKVICFKHGYHGDTFGAMSVAGKNAFNRPFWSSLFEIEAIDPPLPGQEQESIAQLEKILTKETAACFIFEPLILGVGGMYIYPPQGLDALMRLCRQHGVLTITDEVFTGFGRTGPLFACELLAEIPDILCLAKAITGGFMPLGATICKEFIFDAFLEEKNAFLHGHSYTANPLACSAALASLDLLEKQTCSTQRALIAQSHQQFCKKWKGHPRLIRCESLGTILVLEYRTNTCTSYSNPLRDRLYNHFIGHNILLRPFGNVLHIVPPYCIQPSELSLIYDAIIHSLENL